MGARLLIKSIDYWEPCPECHAWRHFSSIYTPTPHLTGGLWEHARARAAAEHVHRWVA